MAFPTVSARSSAETPGTGNVTSHAITLPTHSSGQLLVVVFTCDGPNVTDSVDTGASSADWQAFSTDNVGAGCHQTIFYKTADSASETLTITTSAAEQSSHIAFAISPGSGFECNIEKGVANSGTSAAADPPNLAPSAGTQDYLWIAVAGTDSSTIATVAPTDYGNLTTITASGGGASTSTAERSLNASSQNPDTFTLGATQRWIGQLLGIWLTALPDPPANDSKFFALF